MCERTCKDCYYYALPYCEKDYYIIDEGYGENCKEFTYYTTLTIQIGD